ncbi:MAG: helix-hairpin-helix domain-containing protein [Myxococcales bacterium]
MAIEDFEWGGDVEVTRPSQARLAAEAAAADDAGALAGGKRWFESLRKSVWLEPALRLGGMALLLAVLAGIGVVATTYAKPGLKLPEGSRLLTDALGTSWLKASPSPEPSPKPVTSSQPAGGASPTAPVLAAEAAPAAATLAAEPAPSGAPAPSGGAPAGITADGKVILNLASADELTKLPGVGMKRATAIVALRTKLKRFKHPSDLLRVKGIGPRGLQRMLPHLVLDPPPAS